MVTSIRPPPWSRGATRSRRVLLPSFGCLEANQPVKIKKVVRAGWFSTSVVSMRHAQSDASLERSEMNWDLLIPLSALALLLLLIIAYATGEEYPHTHRMIGYGIAALLVASVLWLVLRSRDNGLSGIDYSPRANPGANPAGEWRAKGIAVHCCDPGGSPILCTAIDADDAYDLGHKLGRRDA
jgi:hypothetical protein